MAWRKTLVRSLAKMFGVREYDGAKHGNHVWGGSRPYASASADADLSASSSVLRERSRNAYQNSASARAIVESLVGLVVSSGIDVEPDSGDESSDAALREAWSEWVEHADAAGKLDLWEIQRQAFRSVVTAGEALIVLVDLAEPSRPIPFAMSVIEPDQLASEPVAKVEPGNRFVCGVESDRYGRPVAYHILAEPAEESSLPLGGSLVPGSGGKETSLVAGKRGGGQRIPADRVIHAYEIQRPGQTRGEPWLSPVLGTLHQERQLVEAELTSAKVGAAHAVAILSDGANWPEATDPNAGTDQTGQPSYDFAPGSISKLAPGEKLEIIGSNRPSQQIAPFRTMLRGDLAGAMRLPQRLIDRDVSKANYSSMRADMLDTRRQLDPVQQWFGRALAQRVYQAALPQLAVAAGVQVPSDPAERRRFGRCKIMPDGWAYVDPQKDVAAGIESIRAGFSTWQEEIQGRGRDPRRVREQLGKELSDPLLASVFGSAVPNDPLASDKSFVDRVKAVQDAIAKAGVDLPWPVAIAAGAANTAPGAFIAALTKPQQPPSDESPSEAKKEGEDMTPEDRARFERMERIVDGLHASRSPAVTVEQRIAMDSATAEVMGRAIAANQPAAVVNLPAPVVHVAAPSVTVEAARVEPAAVVVNVPQQAAPVVNVSAPDVKIDNQVIVPKHKVKATPQPDGSVIMVPQE